MRYFSSDVIASRGWRRRGEREETMTMTMKRSTWAYLLVSLLSMAACDDGEQSLGSAGDCAPVDAQAVGQCDLGHGVKYTADGCVSVVGCECAGADCDLLFETYDACAETCLSGTACGPNVGCPDNGICENGACVYQ
jgi:hypothetical protein